MAKWPYGTPEWKALRASKLKASPICEPCQRRGRVVAANTVDHRISITNGGPAFPLLSGLMSMCPACHNAKTRAVDRPGGSGVAFPGCDASGLPVDPSHPFFGGPAKGYTPSKDKALGAGDRLGSSPRTKFRGGR
ncbi:HNH endonuclease [Methylobacterium sp. WL12]|nr:HNH endonuclease [Methylobacterium sp. WL12]